MSGYTKLFNSILASTIWEADMPTRIVWITLLAMKDKYGLVEASVPGLATLARVTVPQARAAIANLKAPDPDSRSQEEQGRRIRDVDGGWQVINHEKYRNLLSADERREYLRVKQAEHRRKQPSTKVNTVNSKIDKSTELTHTDTDPEADTKAEISTTPLPPSKKTASAPSALNRGFQDFWTAYPRKIGKSAAFKAWKRLNPNEMLRAQMLKTLTLQCRCDQWTRDHGQFIPHPTTWLNQGRWDDELTPTTLDPHDTAVDWWEECKLIHNGECNGDRMRHHLRKQTEQFKAAKAI